MINKDKSVEQYRSLWILGKEIRNISELITLFDEKLKLGEARKDIIEWVKEGEEGNFEGKLSTGLEAADTSKEFLEILRDYVDYGKENSDFSLIIEKQEQIKRAINQLSKKLDQPIIGANSSIVTGQLLSLARKGGLSKKVDEVIEREKEIERRESRIDDMENHIEKRLNSLRQGAFSWNFVKNSMLKKVFERQFLMGSIVGMSTSIIFAFVYMLTL